MDNSKSRGSLEKYEKKDNHYIDKKEFHEELVAFKTDPENIRRVENGERPIIPESIGEKILMLCERHSYNWKFGDRFWFRDEMVLDAAEICIRYIWNYKHEEYDNPFGYFNLTIKQEFIKRIKKEKVQFKKKAKWVQNIGVMSDIMDNSMFSDDTDETGVTRDIQENIQKYYDYDLQADEEKEREKKEEKAAKKKKKSGNATIEKFYQEEE